MSAARFSRQTPPSVAFRSPKRRRFAERNATLRLPVNVLREA